MTVAPFTIELILVGLITLFILHQYGNWRKQHHIVTVAVFISWYFSFLIVFVLPLDVSSTLYRQCRDSRGLPPVRRESYVIYENKSDPGNETGGGGDQPSCEEPWSFLPRQTLPDLWRVVYWTSQLLSWIILPMMQSYSYAGDFTVRGKVKTALYENALWYGSYLVIFGVLLIYVIVKPDLDVDGNHLKLICITASNTWGLLLLVLLMGYGLVEVPRTAWNHAKAEYCLAHAYFKVSKLSTEREEAEEKLTDVLEEVKKASESIRYTHPLRKDLEVIMWKCPESSQTMFSKGTDDFVDYEDVQPSSRGSSSMIYTEKTLIKLHRKVIMVTQTSKRTNCQWNMILDKCITLEDLIRNTGSTERVYRSSFAKPYTGLFENIAPSLEWYLKVWIIPYGLRALGVFLAIMSLALVWSEVTFFIVKEPISLFALLISVAKKGYMYFYVELISCLTMTYMCVCVYYTVFKMRIFNYYYLAHNHQTDPNSLLFSGILLCRLTYALCLNFLGLIHLDTHVTKREDQETSFTYIMGHMDVLSFISNGFNIYYPMTVVLVCLATYFNLGSRCLHCLGFQAFIMEDELSAEYIGEGKDIVKRERRRRELGSNGRKDWSDRAKNIRSKFSSAGRTASNSNDEVVTSQTRLTSSEPKVGQYTRFDTEQDRIELLQAVDYDENSALSDFRPLAGTSSTRSARTAPNNIFDDV